ncbi:hypothetical protein [Streptomyces sp. NPDC090131]|uniref:hypothetical protein n=1 Tax=Streptomyces sp. NPDC090131 TaxID=3365954 RepID=UPI003811C4BF
MANTPVVTVGAPDDRGLRKVLIDGIFAGKVWSDKELRRVLSREGVPDGHPVLWLGEDGTVWPDRAGLRRATGLFMVLGLLATAYPLFKIGYADSGDALTYGGRIAGCTIVAVALVELGTAGAAVDYWGKRRWCYSGVAVLVGVLIALFCSVSLLLLQIGEHFNRYTTIGIALCVWSLAALSELHACRAWMGLSIPRSIAIGVIVSTLLAASNLAYSQVYVPYMTTPLVQSGAEFREANLARSGAPMYVTVHLYVKNAGQVPVYVLGSIYWIHGAPASPPDTKPTAYDLIYDGEFVTPVGRVLNPGEEVAQDAVVEITDPENAKRRPYEALRAQTEVYVIRKDRMTMSSGYARSRVGAETIKKDAEEGTPIGAKYRYRSQIENSSEILNATRGPQRVTVWRVAGGAWPRINVDVSPPGERIEFDPNEPFSNEDAIKRYGLSQVRGIMAQTPYQELLEKARSTVKASSPPK